MSSGVSSGPHCIDHDTGNGNIDVGQAPFDAPGFGEAEAFIVQHQLHMGAWGHEAGFETGMAFDPFVQFLPDPVGLEPWTHFDFDMIYYFSWPAL